MWPSGRRIVHVEACSALELYIWIFADVFVFILGFSCTTEFLINGFSWDLNSFVDHMIHVCDLWVMLRLGF